MNTRDYRDRLPFTNYPPKSGAHSSSNSGLSLAVYPHIDVHGGQLRDEELEYVGDGELPRRTGDTRPRCSRSEARGTSHRSGAYSSSNSGLSLAVYPHIDVHGGQLRDEELEYVGDGELPRRRRAAQATRGRSARDQRPEERATGGEVQIVDN
ncbi:hypothetical protein JYU34_019503 [Plutella xylostella]|uniref:Uncharacterized protein n=1 Tax=Plutella xylostella TaxID=51655 RepID=A0ABQ7PWY0_PLUXY|nr:hypothetical protein JYU34_019503 [Plutella xylostella]